MQFGGGGGETDFSGYVELGRPHEYLANREKVRLRTSVSSRSTSANRWMCGMMSFDEPVFNRCPSALFPE